MNNHNMTPNVQDTTDKWWLEDARPSPATPAEPTDAWWVSEPNNHDQVFAAAVEDGLDRWWIDGRFSSPGYKVGLAAMRLATEPGDGEVPRTPFDVYDSSAASMFENILAKVESHAQSDMTRDSSLGDPECIRSIGPGTGWKIHLNFNAELHSAFVDSALAELSESFSVTNDHRPLYKIGNGGGIACAAPGKEATIYVGSMADLLKLSTMIEEHPVADVLLPPDYDQLAHDVPVSGLESKVWARFDMDRKTEHMLRKRNLGSPLQYGGSGVGNFSEHLTLYDVGGRRPKDEYKQTVEKLHSLFGNKFIGEHAEYFKMVEDSSIYKQAVEAALHPSN